ncbi:MAG: hypothetical protein A2X64_06125 [Ignavibacteria bacterium GWF2_33_9]|nr:MAG: hypothetical protein A2X64_06125 [Ignavibacteria bacterium GWF2_33_9]
MNSTMRKILTLIFSFLMIYFCLSCSTFFHKDWPTVKYPNSYIEISFMECGIGKENMLGAIVDSTELNTQNELNIPVYWFSTGHDNYMKFIDEVKRIKCQIENGSKDGTYINIDIIENGIYTNIFWLGSDSQIIEYRIMSDKLFGKKNFYPFRKNNINLKNYQDIKYIK